MTPASPTELANRQPLETWRPPVPPHAGEATPRPQVRTADAPGGCAWTVGARVAVDRTAYPDESCNEHGGLAYEGTITGFTSSTAKITFKKISRRTNTNYRGDVPLSLLRAIP